MDSEDLDTLIQAKEKEIQNISRLRLKQLEAELRQKNLLLEEMTAKIIKLQKDFDFNLKLIRERDQELSEIEENAAKLHNIIRNKDAELQASRALNSETEENRRTEAFKLKTELKILQQEREKASQDLSEMKWKKTEEIHSLRLGEETKIRELEGILKQKLKELNVERDAILEKYREIINSKENEFQYSRGHFEKKLGDSYMEIENLRNEVNVLAKKCDRTNYEEQLLELRQSHCDQMRVFSLTLDEKDTIIQKLNEEIRNTRENEATLYEQLQRTHQDLEISKDSLLKDNTKLKSEFKEEILFIQQNNEIQLNRFNTTYKNQVNTLEEKLYKSEEENQNNKLTIKQLKEKNLQSEMRKNQEIQDIEEFYKNELNYLQTALKTIKQSLWERESEASTFTELIQQSKSKFNHSQKENLQLKQLVQDNEIQMLEIKKELPNKAEIQRLYESKLKDQQMIKDLITQRNSLEQDLRETIVKNEDFPPPTPVKSYISNNLEEENLKLKEIISEMTQEIKQIKQKTLQRDPSESTEKCSKLKNEVIRLQRERDQLLNISAELKAKSREDKRYKFQEFLKNKALPKYDNFEEIIHEIPEHDFE